MKKSTFQGRTMGHVQVIALGGSLLRPEEERKGEWLNELVMMTQRVIAQEHRVIFVIGGGAPAREHIEMARSFITASDRLDMIGIAATRLNACMLQQIFIAKGLDVSDQIPTTVQQAAGCISSHSIVVMGGTIPGQTTDTVAVEVAVEVQASHCIVATNVSHVYTKDPRVHPDARPIEKMTLEELSHLCGPSLEPGQSTVVDPVAIRRAMDGNMRISVLDGRDANRLRMAMDHQPFIGTVIEP